MAIQTTYTQARAKLANLLDRVTLDKETVIIERRGGEKVAMISASELTGLIETAHLMRSPKNAQRLLSALTRSFGKKTPAMSVADLRKEVGLD